jgi:transglutaminase-like putative cysteine protease
MIDLLATLGLLALVSSGELNKWMSVGVLLALAVAVTLPHRWQEHRVVLTVGTYGPLLLLTLQLSRWFLGEPLITLAVEFAAALQVVRLATRRGAAHDQQVLVLALLHLIAGTVLGGGLTYALCFLGFLIVGPGALVLSHLRREVEGNYRQGARDRTGLPVDVPRILRSRRVVGKHFLLFTCSLSIPIFVFTAVLFVLFPRVGLSLLLLNHARPERMVGFSDHVDLGGVGRLRSDPKIAMRVQFADRAPNPPPRVALYLRGTAFDRYDGRTWSRTLSRNVPLELRAHTLPLRRFPDPSRDRKMTIELEPIDPPVIFVPAGAVALQVLPRGAALLDPPTGVYAGPEGELKYASFTEGGLRYTAYLGSVTDTPSAPLLPQDRVRYLALPDNTTNRMADLARAWAGGQTDPLAQAKAIETRLRTAYRYDVDSPSGAEDNPLDHFLFESHRGHCEFYSTAMAVLLRVLGVPTRTVTGFFGGTYNRFGEYYAVRQGDAHSWLEAYISGRGWVRFDPTPPANAAPQGEISGAFAFVRDFVEAAAQRYSRHVISYDLHQQLRLLGTARRVYGEIRHRSGLPAILGSNTRLALVLAGGLLVGFGLYWLLRARPPRSRRQQLEASGPPADRKEIVRLYSMLEVAMAARGVPRQPATPPLGHARALAELGHPVGSDVLELTQVYLDVRFGGQELTDAQRQRFARRVRELRHASRDLPRLRRAAA